MPLALIACLLGVQETEEHGKWHMGMHSVKYKLWESLQD